MPPKAAHSTHLGFTLVELAIVIAVLGVLGAVALPRFLDFREDATRAKVQDLEGRLRSSLASLELSYELGNTAGLPPDVNGDSAPDHLGDLSSSEPTLFDALLDHPLSVETNGWKPYAQASFPIAGRFYLYFYDADGDSNLDLSSEAYLLYDALFGNLTSRIP